MDNDTLIHRIGPATVENFQLKRIERKVSPIGISVLIGGTAKEASNTMKRAFDKKELHELARTVSTSSLGDVRACGYQVIAIPSVRLPNHGRLFHGAGEPVFETESLTSLVACFQQWEDQ